MSFQIVSTFGGEIGTTTPDTIEIKEYHTIGRQLLTDDPHIICPNLPPTCFELIQWIKDWDMELQKNYNGMPRTYHLKMVMGSTLNEIFDGVLIHKKYKNRKYTALDGKIGISESGRFKIGTRILYNWFVSSVQRLKEDQSSYIYMEITADVETEDT